MRGTTFTLCKIILISREKLSQNAYPDDFFFATQINRFVVHFFFFLMTSLADEILSVTIDRLEPADRSDLFHLSCSCSKSIYANPRGIH